MSTVDSTALDTKTAPLDDARAEALVKEAKLEAQLVEKDHEIKEAKLEAQLKEKDHELKEAKLEAQLQQAQANAKLEAMAARVPSAGAAADTTPRVRAMPEVQQLFGGRSQEQLQAESARRRNAYATLGLPPGGWWTSSRPTSLVGLTPCSPSPL